MFEESFNVVCFRFQVSRNVTNPVMVSSIEFKSVSVSSPPACKYASNGVDAFINVAIIFLDLARSCSLAIGRSMNCAGASCQMLVLVSRIGSEPI